jgi:hypothetical protein
MNFCTLFDSYYIHKGIALYLSLEKVTENFHLYVMAFDKKCYDRLQNYGFKHMTVELVDNFETPELLDVKATRTKAEYCWTCGPSVIYYFINRYNLCSLTYLDADLYFMNSPQVLFDEIDKNSVALSEHFLDEESPEGGKYCVQFVYFKNDVDGIAALKWWRDSCIDWCYSRYEDGKYGDQKYLDYIPERFSNVYIIKNRGCGVAPWNMKKYKYFSNGELEYNNIRYPIIFFHMHGTSICMKNNVLSLKTITYDIDNLQKEHFFLPYLELLRSIYKQFFNITIKQIKIKDRPISQQLYSKLKSKFRKNGLARWFYYDVLKVRYNGYESKK